MLERKIHSCEDINSHYRLKYWKIIKKANGKIVGLSEGFNLKVFLKGKVGFPQLHIYTGTFHHEYALNSKQNNFIWGTRDANQNKKSIQLCSVTIRVASPPCEKCSLDSSCCCLLFMIRLCSYIRYQTWDQ